MIKPISAVTFFSLAALSLNTQADVEPGVYLGLDLSTSLTGTAKAEVKSNGSTSKAEADVDASSVGVYLGYRFASNNRFQISRTSIDVELESNDEVTFSGTDFDWHFVYGDEQIQPYWGLGFGFYTYEDTAAISRDNEDLTGISFQLRGGIKIDIHEHVELDMSYRAKSIMWQTIEIYDGYDDAKVDLQHSLGSLNFGVAVKF